MNNLEKLTILVGQEPEQFNLISVTQDLSLLTELVAKFNSGRHRFMLRVAILFNPVVTKDLLTLVLQDVKKINPTSLDIIFKNLKRGQPMRPVVAEKFLVPYFFSYLENFKSGVSRKGSPDYLGDLILRDQWQRLISLLIVKGIVDSTVFQRIEESVSQTKGWPCSRTFFHVLVRNTRDMSKLQQVLQSSLTNNPRRVRLLTILQNPYLSAEFIQAIATVYNPESFTPALKTLWLAHRERLGIK